MAPKRKGKSPARQTRESDYDETINTENFVAKELLKQELQGRANFLSEKIKTSRTARDYG